MPSILKKPCTIEGCGYPQHAKKLCDTHYKRLRQYGTPYPSRPLRRLHGLSEHQLYETWVSMKKRCYNKQNHAYRHYGGRGITVCERWLYSFPNFLQDMGERPAEMSLDRIDNDGDYSPGNCKWSTQQQQVANQRTRRTNTTGYPGLRFDKKCPNRPWQVRIRIDGKECNFGYFADVLEAYETYAIKKESLGLI